MKKVFIRTFGCQMNEYDSEKMLSVLAEGDDLVQVSEADEADIILFNTCSVREKAQEKVFSDLARALRPVRPLLPAGSGPRFGACPPQLPIPGKLFAPLMRIM